MKEFEVINGIGIIPQGITALEKDSFHLNDSLRSIEIPEGIRHISSNAFHSCQNLESVSIPSSVESIDKHPFLGCQSLKRIIVNENNSTYDSRDNCNAIIETNTNCLIVGCSETYIPHDIKTISSMAFRACRSLYNITIPEGIEIIRKDAFCGARNLYAIEFKGRTILESGAFRGCSKLKHTNLSEYKEITAPMISVVVDKNLMETTYVANDGSQYWALNNKYEKLFSCAYSEMKCLAKNLYAVKDGDYWRLFIPGPIYSPESNYYNAHKFESCEAVSVFNDIVILRDNHKLYIWQVYNRILSENYYDSIDATPNSAFSPPMIVSKSGFYSLVDRKGYEILDCQYSSIRRFMTKYGEADCHFKLEKSGKYGAYTPHVLLEPRYEDVELCNGYLIVSENGYKGIVHFDGTPVLRSIYEEIYDFSCEANKYESEYIIKKDGRYGIVNSKEEIVLPIEYDTIIRVFSDDDMYSYFEDYYCDDDCEYQAYSRDTGSPCVIYATRDGVVSCYKFIDKQWIMVVS